MSPLTVLAQAGLYLVMALSLIAALGVVVLPNIFRASLCLVGTLLGVAVLYIALGAEFIAVVQILLYVGAVMTLVIFAIMLTERIGDQTVSQKNKQSAPAFAACLLFVGFVGPLLLKTRWSPAPTGTIPVDTLALGRALLGEYVFPFEVVSIVLIAALIGAVVIARKD